MTREYYEREVGAYQQGYRRGLEEGHDYCERRRARVEWAKLVGLVVVAAAIGCSLALTGATILSNLHG